MKKTVFLLFSLCFLLGVSYGQNKLSPELIRAAGSTPEQGKIGIIITLAEQYNGADLDTRTANMSRKGRNQLVVNELKSLSQRSQAGLLALLEGAGDQVSDLHAFWIFNGISCQATPAMIQTIAQRSEVACVDLDTQQEMSDIAYTEAEPTRDFLPWSVSHIQANDVWSYLGDTGYTGEGVVVAVIGSGVNYNHEDLVNSMWDGGSAFPGHGYNIYSNTKYPLETTSNGNGVGTMAAGIVAGQGIKGRQTGVAPGAKIMAVKTINKSGQVTEAKLNQGIEWAVDTTKHQAADILVITYNIEGVGCSAANRTIMDNLLSAGIVVFTAAGDYGDDPSPTVAVPNKIAMPANSPSPWHNPEETMNGARSANICVGAVDQSHYKAVFSSIGPVTWADVSGYNDYAYTPGSTTQTGLIRPDVVAPGVNITSTSHTNNVGYITSAKGTAFGAAHAAGVAALLLEANPNLTPADIDRLLETSATKCEGLALKNNYYGAGFINAYDAMTALLSTLQAPTNLNASADGNTVTLNWTAAAGAASYNVYCNEQCVATNVTGTSYAEQTDFSGAHTYYLRAVDNNGTLSPKSNYAAVFVDPEGPIVNNLHATVNNDLHQVALTWDLPNQANYMRYGQSETMSGAYNGAHGLSTYWAQRYPSDVLVDYAGTVIDTISIYFSQYKATTYTLRVYDGNPNGPDQKLFEKQFTVASNEINAWKKIALTTPIALDHTKDLWIVMYDPKAVNLTSATNLYTANATYCLLPEEHPTGFPALKSSDGHSWAPQDERWAWMIKAHLTTGTYTYNVQRDEITIATNRTALNYTDTNVADGVHYYTVTTNYNNGQSESFPCTPARANMNTQFVVTYDAGDGTCPVPSQTQGGTTGSVTLPEATPSALCQSEGYTFAGWSTEIVEGTYTQPELFEAGTDYIPDDDITLYAVYQNIQSEYGWKPARSLQTGDQVCLVSQDYGVELDDIATGTFSASTIAFDTDPQGEHPFTAQARNGGYTLKDAEGRYLYNQGGFLQLSTSLYDGCVWTAEFINGNAYLRNRDGGNDYQIMARNQNNSIVFASVNHDDSPQTGDRLIQLYRFKGSEGVHYAYNPGCGTVVKDPIFSPEADGIYLDPLSVSLSCNTQGAAIHYTSNNATPTASSPTYTAPINVNGTFTLKAKAFKDGMTPSGVVTQTYVFPTQYNSIFDFKDANNPTEIARISSTMTVTFHQGRYLYVSDDTGGLLVYDDYDLVSETFAEGDQITLLQGRYRIDNEQPMLIPLAPVTKDGNGEVLDPIPVSVEELEFIYYSMDAQLVQIENVVFNRSYDSNGDEALDTLGFVQNGNAMVMRNLFENLDGDIDHTYHYDLTGLLGIQGSTMMIYPRDMNDIRQYHTITCAPTEHGTLSADQDQASHLSLVTLTATADSLYHLESLYYYTTDPNNPVNIDLEEASFEMPDENVTVVAVFAEDIRYTVSFNPGNGQCDTPSAQESAWNAGVTLPAATPSIACAAQGYTFVGWAESFIEESMARPQLFAAESTYHPTSDLTLYAVYSAPSGGDWQEVTTTQQLIEGDYIIASYSDEASRYYFLKREGVVGINPTARKINKANTTPPQDITPVGDSTNNHADINLWTIAKISSTEYSISYTEDGITYYLESFNTSAQNNRVTTTPPARGWKFINNSQHGLLIQFPSVTTERYLDIYGAPALNGKWYSHILSALEGEIHLYRSPSNLYSTNPECQMAVATPEFVNVPDGLILTDNYMVTITCATEGATIHYTTDGSTPDANAPVYAAPFAITESCTVNAIAYNSEGAYSEVATQAFSFPAQFENIAAFKQAYSNTNSSTVVSRIAGDVQFVFRHGNYIYLADESAGLLVRDNNGVITRTYQEGDVIKGGIVGTYLNASQQPMLIPTANPAAGVSGTPVAPLVATADEVKNNYDLYDARLVTILDAKFTEAFNFASTPIAVANDGTSLNINNRFGTVTLSGAAGAYYDITGLVGKYVSGTYQVGLYPRANSDFVPYYHITCATLEQGTLSTTPDHARAGDEVTLIAEPANGYAFGQWTVTGPNGGAVTVTGDHFVMPAGEVTVSASFTQIDYTIIITALPPEGGTVTEGGIFHYGDVIQLTATPNPGYKFLHWTIGGKYDYHNPLAYTVKGDDDIIGDFQATSTEYQIEVLADGHGTVSGGGSYLSGTQVTVTATPDEDYQFMNWTENDEVVSTEAAYTFVATENRTLTAHFGQGGGEVEQTLAISAGWTWWSTYLEASDALFTEVKDAIAATNTSATIKSSNNSIMYQGGAWQENQMNPLVLENESMYMINLENTVTATVSAMAADPANHPITLAPGWNWIGFISTTPMTVEEALADLSPNNGDVIKGTATSSYTSHWNNPFDMIPGEGYMYNNCGTDALTFTYPTSAKAYVRSMPAERYWNTDTHRHATNLVVMATLDASQYAMAEGNYEIGAFVGDECRGSNRLVMADGQYVAFMVVWGEPNETIRFKLYDVTNGKELGMAEEQLTYVPNAIVGSVPEPEVLHFRGTTSLDENANSLSVYPNPANQWITIEAKDLQSATLYSLTGQAVLHEEIHTEATRLNVSQLTPGLYLLQVIRNDGSTVTRKVTIQ